MSAATFSCLVTSPEMRETAQPQQVCATELAVDICIGWVDSSRMTRECMTQVIAHANPRFNIVPFETARRCILEAGLSTDLFVYFLHRPDTVGLSDVLSLRAAFPDTSLVVISDTATINDAIVRNLLLEGVSGFLHSTRTSLQVAISALTLVGSGGSFIPKEFLFLEEKQERPLWPSPSSDQWVLTPRERAVLDQVRDGQPNKVIANELGVRPNTVKVHIRNIMRKMRTRNRTEAAVIANSLPVRYVLDLN